MIELDFFKNSSDVFFDMDGTILYSDYANLMAYRNSLEIIAPRAKISILNGRDRITREFVRTEFSELGDDILSAIINKKEECYSQFLHLVELNLEVVRLIEQLCVTHNLTLVTRSSKARALQLLEFFGLTSKFNNFFFKEDYAGSGIQNKYLLALTMLKVQPTKVIVFDNDANEIDLALLAGIDKIIKVEK